MGINENAVKVAAEPLRSETIFATMRRYRTCPPRALQSSALAFLMFAAATPALAEDDDKGWTVRVGLGGQITPEYPGSDDMRISPYPVISVRRTGDPIAFGAPGDSPGITLIKTGGLQIGPIANLAPKRKAKDVGIPIEKVKTTFEAGAFIQFYLSKAIRVRAEGRRGIGGHKGWIGSTGTDFIIRDKDRYIFSIGPRVRFSSQRYQRAYFGITPATAVASGLPVYDPDGGIHAIGVNAGALYQFNYHWGMTGYARYDRLVHDAADSPLVRTLGSRNQFSAGVALTYTFDIGKL